MLKHASNVLNHTTTSNMLNVSNVLNHVSNMLIYASNVHAKKISHASNMLKHASNM